MAARKTRSPGMVVVLGITAFFAFFALGIIARGIELALGLVK